MPNETITGAKYVQGRDVKEVAVDVRTELRSLFPVASGFKFSVKVSRYSQGQSINVEILACPFDVDNPRFLEAFAADPCVSAMDCGGRWTTDAAGLYWMVNHVLNNRNQERGNWAAFYTNVTFDV